MLEIGKINCVGRSEIRHRWTYDKIRGINRLYYIHSGKGCYISRGEKIPFQAGCIYFFPYNAEYAFDNDLDNPIDHTYADFELIPPVIHNGILKLEPKENKLTKAACDVFNCFAAESDKGYDGNFNNMLHSSIAYLTGAVIEKYGIKPIEDELVISVIEEMIDSMSDNVLIEEMAKKRYITSDGLIRHFSKIMGVTPYAYLKGLRKRTALYMLNNGKSLAETAAATGYSDSSSLLHAIR